MLIVAVVCQQWPERSTQKLKRMLFLTDNCIKQRVAGGDEDHGGDNNDDENCVDFAADGGIVASEMAKVTNRASKNPLKLCNHAAKTFIEWLTKEMDHLLKLDKFCNLPENAVNCSCWKLLVGLELMSLFQKI